MDYRTQYIETLIKLIELNTVQDWTSYFIGLRSGGSLPGGGAGSLNDWGSSYTDDFQDDWYSRLYRILRFLFDDGLTPARILDYKPVENNNRIQILRCLNCHGRYQHPSVFESHIAIDFYKNQFLQFCKSNKLVDILSAKESYESEPVILYRKWLKDEYDKLDIKIYNFVKSGYVCPYCNSKNCETEHDLFKLKKSIFKKRKLSLVKKKR